jgi:hypothetical protein
VSVTATVDLSTGAYFSGDLPVLLSAVDDGTARVAWTDTAQNVHVTPLDASLQRAADDLTVAGEEMRGLVAHDDGAAVLVRRGHDMRLVRLFDDGSTPIDVEIIGDEDESVVGNKWIGYATHEGRLVWDGSRYAAYFGHMQKWSDGIAHQGDILRWYDANGASTSGSPSWSWGCSHSLDVRAGFIGTTLGTVCLSDAFPSHGFHYNHDDTSLFYTQGNQMGLSDGRLGGFTTHQGEFYVTFTSPEGRSSDDIALMSIDTSGTASPVAWLTETNAVDEGDSYLASYGDDLLVGWWSGGALQIAVSDEWGGLSQGPVALTAEIGPRDDMVTLANGDVAWAYAWGSMDELKVVRVALCE